MKDALSHNRLPIVQEEMNEMAVKTSANNVFSNISNGYYGYYQLLPGKTEVEHEEMETQTNQMDVLMHGNNNGKLCAISESRCFDNVHLRLAYRKRACEYGSSDAPEFKKRREIAIERNGGRKEVQMEDLLEELLRETHGSNFYNYWSFDDI